MAVNPIDLQTLFMQMNQVSRDQANAKEGAAVQQSIQASVMQKKLEEKTQAVHQEEDLGDGTKAIKNRPDEQSAGSAPHEGEKKEEEGKEESGKPEVVRDPRLGTHIDISG